MGRTLRQRQQKDRKCWSRSLASNPSLILLMKWLNKHGWKPACRLMPAKFPCTGRGLMADCNVSEGDVIASIPVSLLITTATMKDTEIGNVLSRAEGESYLSQQVLAVLLAWEHHLGEMSTWDQYISMLPTSFSTPHYLETAFVDVLPEFLQDQIRSSQDIAKRSHEHILSCVKDYQCSHCNISASDIIAWEKYLWSWCCVNTRAVYIQPDLIPQHNLKIKDTDCLALAPFLDLFNHTFTAKVQAGLNVKNKSYEIRTLVPFKKYNEVFISYGPHSNVKLFVEYGFIIPSNPHESIPLTFEQLQSAIQANNLDIVSEWDKRCFLKKHGLLSKMVISVNGLSWNASVVLGILLSESSNSKMWESIAFSHLQDSSASNNSTFLRVLFTLFSTTKNQLHECHEKLSTLQLSHSNGNSESYNHTPSAVCCELIRELISITDSALQLVAKSDVSQV